MAIETIITYGPGGYDETKPNNNIIETKEFVVRDDDSDAAK